MNLLFGLIYKNMERIDGKGMNSALFKWCRQFYKMYPQIGGCKRLLLFYDTVNFCLQIQ